MNGPLGRPQSLSPVSPTSSDGQITPSISYYQPQYPQQHQQHPQPQPQQQSHHQYHHRPQQNYYQQYYQQPQNQSQEQYPQNVSQIRQEAQNWAQRGVELLQRPGQAIDRVLNANSYLIQSNSSLSISKVKAENRVTELERNAETFAEQLNNSDATLRGENGRLEEANERLETRNKELERQLKEAREDLCKASKAQEGLAQIKEAYEKLEGSNAELNKQLNEAQDLHREKESKASEDLATCQQQSSLFEALVAKLQVDHEQSRSQEQIRAHLDGTKGRNVRQTVGALREQKRALNSAVHALAICLDDATKQLNDVQRTKDAASKEVERLQKKCQTEQETWRKADDFYKSTKKAEDDLEAKAKIHESDLQKVGEQLEEEKNSHTTTAAQLKTAQDDSQKARDIAASDSLNAANHLQAKKEAVQTKEAAEKRSAKLEGDLKTAVEETKAANLKLKDLQNVDAELQVAKQRITKLEEELDQEEQEARKKIERTQVRKAEREGQKRHRPAGDVDGDDSPVQKRPHLTRPHARSQ